jgi:hypothetical protein
MTVPVIFIKYPYMEEGFKKALMLSAWCKSKGMVHGKDYDWAFQTTTSKLYFRFFNNGEKMATMFALTWAKEIFEHENTV